MGKDKKTLPTNRFEAFKDICLNQLRLLLKLGLLVFIICLPIIISFILTNIKIYEVNLLLESNTINTDEALLQTTGYVNARNIIFIVLIPLTLYLLSGIFSIIRKTVWQEGIIFWYDFKKGIKQNGKYFALIGFIFSILFFVFNYTLKEELLIHSTANFIAVAFSGIALFVTILFAPFLLHQTIIYNLKFTYKIKNTLIIFSKLLYLFLMLLVLNLVPILLLFINNGIVLLIVILLDCLILIPIIIVLNTLFTDCCFDAFINHIYFKEIYRKGLFNNAEDIA